MKAAVARGYWGLPIAHSEEFFAQAVELRQYPQQSKVIQVMGRVGTPLLYDVSNYLGAIRTKNSQVTTFTDTLNAEGIHQYVDKMTGVELKFGDYDTLKQLIYDIAARRGIGAALAEGSRLVDRFPGAADFLIAIKGLPQSDPHDVRYLKGFALGIATASRGADHLRSRPTLEIFDLPAEFTKQVYGEPVDPNPTSYRGKAVVVTFSETIYAVLRGCGLCRHLQIHMPRIQLAAQFELRSFPRTDLPCDRIGILERGTRERRAARGGFGARDQLARGNHAQRRYIASALFRRADERAQDDGAPD